MEVMNIQFPHRPCTYLKSVGVENDENTFQAQPMNLRRMCGKKVMLSLGLKTTIIESSSAEKGQLLF